MRRALPVTIAALLVAAGCGENAGGGGAGGSPASDEKAAVVEATRAFQDATLDENADAFCDLLTGSAKEEYVANAAALGGPVSCAESAMRLFDLAGEDTRQDIEQARDALSPSDVRVQGRRATVTLPVSGRKLGLRKVSDEWLVSDPPGGG